MISVIIPVYNDPQGLIDTLESLTYQETDREYEIVVVDNNSDDKTSEVIERFEEDYPDLVKGFEENEIQSSYAARNKGIENAEGDIICFLDADMWVDEDYLEEIASYFEENPEFGYIGCQVKIVDRSGTLPAKFNKLNGFPVEEYLETSDFVPTCCLSLRAEIFEKIGKFDQKLISGGDKEFGTRVANSNVKMRFLDKIVVYHPARSSLKSIGKKYFRIGRGTYQLESRYEDRFSDEGLEWSYLRNYFLTHKILGSSDMEKVMENIANVSLFEKSVLAVCSITYRVSHFAGYKYQEHFPR